MKSLKLLALSAVAFVLLASFSLANQIVKAEAPAAEIQNLEQKPQTHTPVDLLQSLAYASTSIDGVLVSNQALDKKLALITQAAN